MQLDNRAIVVVDDNEITNFYNKDIIQETNKFDDITVETNGENVLTLLKDRVESGNDLPALFLVDIKMPDMDGFELIDLIDEYLDEKGIELSPVFVILTTSDHKRDYEQFDKTPIARKFVSKPLNPEKFQEILAEFEFG